MFAKDFKKWDTILGWVSFAIALIVYALTVEPTGSFWDAGEYISTAAKLQVGHPPGAPLLQMIGAFFAMFAFGDETKIALMVNSVSIVSSAFAVLFTFWTITNLVGKLVGKKAEINNSNAIAILGSGLVGALAFTFSDSFWFNAVETEVYGMASLIMALLLWLGLKWTDNLGDPRGHRWLMLISFVVGLTFGIQFMGFLAIPSIGLLYYFKKYKTTTVKNFLLANIIVVGILILVYKFSLTYVLELFGWSEVFFINEIGLPFNSGSIIMGLLFTLWASDTGAYFAGKTFGRRPLFARVSPKKTWEGSVGGGVAALLMAGVFSYFYNILSPWQWLVIAVLIVVAGTYGDLVESLFKRSIHIKDSGTVIPGHGGFLDRFDGLLIASPVIVVFIRLF